MISSRFAVALHCSILFYLTGFTLQSSRARTGKSKKAGSALFPSRPKNFRIGGDVQPERDLGRFVRWPRYIRVQRQRKVLKQRLRTPPSVNQFRMALDKAEARGLVKLLTKYQAETRAEKAARMKEAADAKAAGTGNGTMEYKNFIKYGLKHVTTLIEQKKAQLVVIAADVEPIELVIWLPALCRKMDIPYVIFNNKSRLGEFCGKQKTTTVACFTRVDEGDVAALEEVKEMAMAKFNNNTDSRRKFGGGIMGLKTQEKLRIREEKMRAEQAKKSMY